jgi:hypothetical protein
MYANEWMSYECSDEGTYTQTIRNSSTRSHPSEEENRTRNRSKTCKCKRAIRSIKYVTDAKLFHIAMFFENFYIVYERTI